jgi:hypothetical protein
MKLLFKNSLKTFDYEHRKLLHIYSIYIVQKKC